MAGARSCWGSSLPSTLVPGAARPASALPPSWPLTPGASRPSSLWQPAGGHRCAGLPAAVWRGGWRLPSRPQQTSSGRACKDRQAVHVLGSSVAKRHVAVDHNATPIQLGAAPLGYMWDNLCAAGCTPAVCVFQKVPRFMSATMPWTGSSSWNGLNLEAALRCKCTEASPEGFQAASASCFSCSHAPAGMLCCAGPCCRSVACWLLPSPLGCSAGAGSVQQLAAPCQMLQPVSS